MKPLPYRSDNRVIVVIPAFEPDERLPLYSITLRAAGIADIVVVDDGSGLRYQSVFSELEESGCTVLRHKQNRGKGEALKTGFRYIEETVPGFFCVVTVDADGRYAPEDVLSAAELSRQNPDALVLGVRDVASAPATVRIGSRVLSALFFYCMDNAFKIPSRGCTR